VTEATPSQDCVSISSLTSLRLDYCALWQASALERCRLVEGGLPLSVVTQLAEDTGVTQSQLTEWLRISAEFYGHQIRGERSLPSTPSERVLGLVRLVGQIETIARESGDPQGVDAPRWMAAWLAQRTPALGGRIPAEIVWLADGREMLSNILGTMASGAYHERPRALCNEGK
jgi:hypothetical protein